MHFDSLDQAQTWKTYFYYIVQHNYIIFYNLLQQISRCFSDSFTFTFTTTLLLLGDLLHTPQHLFFSNKVIGLHTPFKFLCHYEGYDKSRPPSQYCSSSY